jgi:chemotaxis protein histidine kinase CheA
MPKPIDEGIAPDGALVIPETEQANEAEEIAGFEAGLNADVDATPPARADKKPEPKEEKAAEPAPAAPSATGATPAPAAKPDVKPVEKTEETPPVPETAAAKAEAAAKALEAPPPAERKDIFDALPDKYKALKADRDNGKLAEFLRTQPKSVQKLAIESDDPEDARYVLDLYEAAKGVSVQPKPEEKKASTEIKAFVKRFGDREFVGNDGTRRKVSDLIDGYGDPDLFEGLAVVMEAIAGERGTPPAAVSPDGDLAARLEQAEQRIAAQAFWADVLEAHPDARAIKRSGKLDEWVKIQSPGLQRLFTSNQPEHAILVLDAYKESMAKDAKATGVKEAADRKKALDGLHGDTARGGRDVRAPRGSASGKTPEEEADDGFNEGAK